MNADEKTSKMVMVIIKAEGWPASRVPVYRAVHTKAHLTGNRRNIAKPVVASKTQSAVKPEDALTSETLDNT